MLDEDPLTSRATQPPSLGRLPNRHGFRLRIPNDLWAPLILSCAACLIWLGIGFYIAISSDPFIGVLTTVLLFVFGVLQTIVVVAACFLVAAVFGTSFGQLSTALVKIFAATVFPIAVACAMFPLSPLLSCVSIFCLTFGLLKSFFELDLFEVIALVLTQSLVAGLTGILLGVI